MLFILFPILIFVSMSFIIGLICYWKIDEFEDLWIRMKDDWAMERVEEELRIKKSYAAIGQIATKYITVGLAIGLGSFIILTSSISKILDLFVPLNESRHLAHPFKEQYAFVDEKYTPILLVHSFISLTVMMIFAIANQTMAWVHVQHVCGMFAALGHRLQYCIPNPRVKSKADNESVNQIYYKSIVCCIEYHKRTIEFAAILKAYYAPIFCLITVVSIFALSVILVKFRDIETLQSNQILISIILLFLLYVINYFGQMIINASSIISERAYAGQWYYYPEQTKKLLILFIRRCEKPCMISVYNLYISSFNSFRMALQTGFSYFTVLKCMQ